MSLPDTANASIELSIRQFRLVESVLQKELSSLDERGETMDDVSELALIETKATDLTYALEAIYYACIDPRDHENLS